MSTLQAMRDRVKQARNDSKRIAKFSTCLLDDIERAHRYSPEISTAKISTAKNSRRIQLRLEKVTRLLEMAREELEAVHSAFM